MNNSNNMATVRRSAAVWWLGIRPQTLTLALTPVVVGSALAWSEGAAIHALAFLGALLCAALIQVGTNLLNDAGDAARGGDGPERIGPTRITAAGLASAAQVRRAAVASFATALLVGGYLVYIGGSVILLIGLASLAAGYAYSAGRRPISHSPWGEAFVLAFFGVVAVAGSYYLQGRSAVEPAIVMAGLALGCHAAAVLLVNNIRDSVADARAGRTTLALRLGPQLARQLYRLLLLAPFPLLAAAFGVRALGVAWLALPVCLWLAWRFGKMPADAAMNTQLARTALVQVLLGG
ncbi:MAG: 1,4-dihydroxy-2-naphthoate octaprenyltransferase, partial [Gammaproteobacteria bacterium]|nr:1,4-dihydroxy-2-naphthoate octaprenyltransferase [Gammaproteobacteria bacterium]